MRRLAMVVFGPCPPLLILVIGRRIRVWVGGPRVLLSDWRLMAARRLVLRRPG
jgi:hypothetical protein